MRVGCSTQAPLQSLGTSFTLTTVSRFVYFHWHHNNLNGRLELDKLASTVDYHAYPTCFVSEIMELERKNAK